MLPFFDGFEPVIQIWKKRKKKKEEATFIPLLGKSPPILLAARIKFLREVRPDKNSIILSLRLLLLRSNVSSLSNVDLLLLPSKGYSKHHFHYPYTTENIRY